MFRNRKEAGVKLASALNKYKDTNALVLAVPRGGVAVGYEIASNLNLEFSVVVARKLPFPDNPEAGFGAVAEDGSIYFHEEILGELSPDVIEDITRRQKKETRRRVDFYRKGKPLPSLKGRHVILVDDGIAMGSTINASILFLKNKNAGCITVAVPVSSPEIAKQLERVCDEVVVIETPRFFAAVAQVYENWYDMSDKEVMDILNKWDKERAEKNK